MGYARESFKRVRDTCDYIAAEKLHRYSPAYVPLCVALVVMYARPFKRSRVIGMIPEEMIPNEHRFLHDQLLTMRDQVAAHTDADAVRHGVGGFPANNVRVIIQDDGVRSLGIYELKFAPRPFRRFDSLQNVWLPKLHIMSIAFGRRCAARPQLYRASTS